MLSSALSWQIYDDLGSLAIHKFATSWSSWSSSSFMSLSSFLWSWSCVTGWWSCCHFTPVPGQPGARSATPQTIVLPHHHYFYILVSLNSQRHYHTPDPDPQKIIPMIGPLKRKQNEYMLSPLFWSLKLKLGPSPGAIGIARLPLLLSYDAESRTSQRWPGIWFSSQRNW